MLMDWQFLVVTVVALGAGVVLVRRLTPASSKDGTRADPACAHCTTSGQHRATSPTARTSTTPVVSLRDLRETARKG